MSSRANRSCVLMATVALAGAVSTRAQDAGVQGPRVLFSTAAASSTSAVPGVSPTHRFKWIDRPFGDPNGGWLIFSGHARDPNVAFDPNVDEFLIVRPTTAVPDPNLIRVVREGSAIADTGFNHGPFRTGLSIDPNGAIAYSTNSSAGDPNDELIVRATPGSPWSFSIAVREQITQPPGASYEWLGATLDSPNIYSGGLAYHAWSTRGNGYADPNDNVNPNKDEFLVSEANVPVARAGVDSPADDDPNALWQFFDHDAFQMTWSGSHWLARGDLRTSANPLDDASVDDVLVFDAGVVIQQDQVLPGESGPTVGYIERAALFEPNGAWAAYGSYAGADPNEFFVYSGGLIAETEANLPCGGASEKYSDARYPRTFFFVAGSGTQYVYGAATNASDPNADEVLMFRSVDPNYHFPILRSGALVDLDQDGVLDPNDDARILTFREGGGVLTPGGVLFCVVELRAASSAAYVGQALIRFKICIGDADHDGDVDQDDLDLAGNFADPVPCGTEGDVNGDGAVDQVDYDLAYANFECDQLGN